MTGNSLCDLRNCDLFCLMEFQRVADNQDKSPLCLLTTASAGSMGRNIEPINENRKKVYNLLELTSDKVLALKQDHTKIVHNSDELIFSKDLLIGDGLITTDCKVLCVTVADCLPIFLWDSVTGAYGIVHSGWKGTGIAVEAVKKMEKETGSRAENIKAVIGPSIGACCYQVNQERADTFLASLFEIAQATVGATDSSAALLAQEALRATICKKGSEQSLNLKLANKVLLEVAGVKNIYTDPSCTCCGEGFFSYRKSGQLNLMLAIIGYFR